MITLKRLILVGIISLLCAACTKGKTISLIEKRCSTCHPYEKIYGGRPAEEWPKIISRMREISPSLLSHEEAVDVTSYLQKDLKEKELAG